MSERETYLPSVSLAASAHGVPPGILDGVLSAESGYDLDVIEGRRRSTAGALGIGQFMPETAAEMGVNPLDPEDAIDGAARLLKSLHARYGDWAKAVAAYNAGAGRVDNAISLGDQYNQSWMDYVPDETKIYVPRVFASQGVEFERVSPGLTGIGWNLPGWLPDIPNPIAPLVDWGEGLSQFFNAILSREFWARIGFTVVGGGLILTGALLYLTNTPEGKRTISAVASRGTSEVANVGAIAE